MIRRLDLSIQDLKVIREPFTEAHLNVIPNEFKFLFNRPTEHFRAVTLHNTYGSLEKNYHVEFDFNNQESLGTRRLFVLITLLVQTLDIGGTFVLDELGSSMHSFMSREIISLFLNRETYPKGAQLIFCSHETYLLSDQMGFGEDQIWFIEKNAQEESVLNSLLEYNLHNERDFEKKYRQGRFGAVPVIWS